MSNELVFNPSAGFRFSAITSDFDLRKSMYFILSGMFSDFAEVKHFGQKILLKSWGAVKLIFAFLRCEFDLFLI